MTLGRIAWTIAVADVVGFILATLPMPFDPASIVYALGIASFAGVGALLVNRVPANPIGPLLLAAGTTLVVAIGIGLYADVGATQQPPWPAAAFARQLGDLMFFYPFLIAIIGIPLVFPDGRFPSPRFRWVAVAGLTTAIAWTLGGLALVQLDPVVFVMTLISFGGAVVAVWRRYHTGDRTERQQIKWLVADVSVAVAALLPALMLTDVDPVLANAFSSVAIIAMLCLPVVIGIAILRYRLYEIDRIVSRGIAYAAAVGTLAFVFGGIVVILSTLLAEVAQRESIAVAASTLVVFALFQPVLRSVKRRVDRRFNRAHYDAQRTIEAFSAHVRDEVDLPTLRDALVAAAAGAVDPLRSDVWLRPHAERH